MENALVEAVAQADLERDPQYMTENLTAALRQGFERLDVPALRAQFQHQNEFLAVPDFLPAVWLESLRGNLPNLAARVHRNYIPKHKKGGSVSRYVLDEAAPLFRELYTAPALSGLLGEIAGHPLMFCPSDDPHTYALYYYTEPGDHIGYHYDTSYYRGIRYTVLIGLVDNSSCRLECQLYRDDPARETETVSVPLAPGMLVVFNGDKVYHRVTPLGENEERIALTMEYVTSVSMHPLRRFVSNMKDSIAYFGFKQVFKQRVN